MSNTVLTPWDAAREEEEQDLDIDQLRENMFWDEEGLACLDSEDDSEYLDRRYSQRQYDE